MSNGLITLLLVGILLMAAGAIKKRDDREKNINDAILRGETTVQRDPNTRIVYKYLPQDLDTFYRVGDHNVPSKLYAPIFDENTEDMRL
jgi:hypothetical protein